MSSDRSKSSIFRVRKNFKASKEGKRKLPPTPINVIIWTMETLGGRSRGVPIHKIRSFVKEHFVVACNGKRKDVDNKIDTAVMFAVYFGILEQSDNTFILRNSNFYYI